MFNVFFFKSKSLGFISGQIIAVNTKMIICSFVVTIAFPVVLVLESSEIMIVAFYFFFSYCVKR